MQTRLGTVRVAMLKVRNREMGESRMLGMALFDLAPRQRTTAWVERRGVELRVRGLSYRQAVETLDEMLGTRHEEKRHGLDCPRSEPPCQARHRLARQRNLEFTLEGAFPH